jgi:hypothetical protein
VDRKGYAVDCKGYEEWLAGIVNTAIINIFPNASMWHRDAVVRAASTVRVAARRSAHLISEEQEGETTCL